MQSHAMLIGGELVNTDEQDNVINPALAEPFATCARATPAHVDQAVEAASRAFGSWRKDEAFRRQKLNECAVAMQAKANDIGMLLSQEQGKPIGAAVGEVFGASIWFSYYAGLEMQPEILQDDDEKRIQVIRKPLGVIAAITPWNYPIILLTFKLAPALLAGNTVVAKPSPFTPLSSLLLAEILKDTLPAGVLNMITGGPDVGAALTSHPQVRKISFTGGIPTGKKVMESAAGDLKRVTLELGGNDPAIVLDDADPVAISEGLFWGAFQNSGQVCMAIKRLYVPEKLHDPIVAGLVERCRAVKMGGGLEEGTELGPLNNQAQFDIVKRMVDGARRDGASVAVGGEPLDRPGYFYPPTIVTGAKAGMELVDDEQFGTALPVITYKDLDDALGQANNTHFGLSSSVWSGDSERGEAVVREIESGTGWVNQHFDVTPIAPFGGCKWSGMGRESGKWGYEDFTEMQVLNTKK
jgi:acyl-CoA reductase-like NAD-dependent aldehyde dehydrogenase